MSDQFARDVLDGLSSKPKRLPSKYFYNAEGDKLFQRIMELDEYYLTGCELEIFNRNKTRILELIDPSLPFRLVELGAGDGQKTKILLRHFLEKNASFTYCPVDISPDVLRDLEGKLRPELPELKMEPLVGDYFKVLGDLKIRNHQRTICFFLGSNIGNFLSETAEYFLTSIHDNLKQDDLLMIGFDLKKDPKVILRAYDDAEGVTRAFNLNLLQRINDELNADFDLKKFDHNPIYDPLTGECRSYLISKEPLTVHVSKLERSFRFKSWEPIFMEVSKKYDLDEIGELADNSRFSVIENIMDTQGQFTDSVWKVK